MKRVLVCILIHKKTKKINILKNINYNKKDNFLIILDKINLKFDKKKLKNIKIIRGNRKINPVPFYRNLAIKYAKDKYEILLFLDSDVVPSKNIIQKHYDAHKKYKKIPLIGGSVTPSFLIKYKSFWQFLDGVMSWFTSIEPRKDKFISKPYHLPTCNLSIKNIYLKKYKIFFDESLKTGEDVDLCYKFRSLKMKLILIKNADIAHIDRNSFNKFIKHQINWGKHHYHLRYKKLLLKNNNILIILFFLFLYPASIFIFNFIMTYLTIMPWIRKNFLYILCFFPIFTVYFIKSVSTYFEFLKDLKNLLFLKF